MQLPMVRHLRRDESARPDVAVLPVKVFDARSNGSMHQHARQSLRWERRIRSEAPFFVGTGTLALFLVYGNVWLADPSAAHRSAACCSYGC